MENVTRLEGIAGDGTKYYSDSPEVLAYKEAFPEVATDAAIGSVIAIHDNIVNGKEPAAEGEEAMKIVDLVKANIEAGIAGKVDTGEETTGEEVAAEGNETADGEGSEEVAAAVDGSEEVSNGEDTASEEAADGGESAEEDQ